MVEVDKVYESKVTYTGVFNFKDLYNFIYRWMNDNRYPFVVEKTYNEKIKPEGKEIEIVWECRKKVSDYFRFYLKLNWLVRGLTNVEAQQGDIKISTNKGMFEVRITGYLEKDYEHRWEITGVAKFLRGIYDRYIIKSRVESYEQKILEEVDELVAQAKSYLEMEGRKPL